MAERATIAEYTKLDGVKDLQTRQKLYFAKALRAEDEGNHAEASEMLDKAIETQSEGKA